MTTDTEHTRPFEAGGTVELIVHHKKSQVVLVVNDKGVRHWMRVDWSIAIATGDELWWERNIGYLNSEDGLYLNDRIGPCRETVPPSRHWTGSQWVEIGEV